MQDNTKTIDVRAMQSKPANSRLETGECDEHKVLKRRPNSPEISYI